MYREPFAGIIDGEGTVTLTRTHRGEYRRPVVSISSTELPLLLYVRQIVGAGRITNKARVRLLTPRNGRYSPELRVAKQRFENAFFALSTRGKKSTGQDERAPSSEVIAP